MTNDFVSLCVLSYKRPQQLIACLDSLHNTIDVPCEIIVNDDSGTNADLLRHYFAEKKISKLIMGNGNNRGVGRSFQNCLAVAEGQYIFKIDTDILFKPEWLSSSIAILDNNQDVGAVSPFDYHVWDPNDERFKPENNVIDEREDCRIVRDFVSSIYAFRKQEIPIYPIPDDGLHQALGIGRYLALTKKPMVINEAFGVGKSTYVSGTMDHPYKTPTFDTPLIFKTHLVN